MPTYVYQVIGSGSPGEVFEIVQKMSDPPLLRHPVSGQPVRRIPQAPMIGGDHSTAADKRKLSDSNLDRLGFTKYVKSGNGYDKVAGKGPDLKNISKALDAGG